MKPAYVNHPVWRSLLFFSFALILVPMADAQAQGFTDESATAGIVLEHDGIHHSDRLGIGTGAAWLDYNNDGHLDAYITMRLSPNRLYHNNGDGTFTDRAEALGLTDAAGDGAGVAVGDFNNDGWEDLYLANGKGDRLLQNMSGTHFADITARAGFDTTDESRGTSAAWGDYDQDGWLDLYVTNHIPIPGAARASAQDRLYHNNGDGTFTDVSNLLAATATLTGYGFIGSWTDYDRDHDLDLIVINDCLSNNPQPTLIFRNDGGSDPQRNWKFTEVAREVGIDDCRFGMGLAIGDYDGNGWMDIYYSNVGPAILFQNRAGHFTDATATAGVGEQAWPQYSWGTSFLDYDLDGWPDLYLTMGSRRAYSNLDPHPDRLYRNNGNGRDFTDVSDAMNLNDRRRGRTGVIGDYDNDGDPDILLVNYGEAVVLNRNNNANGNHYLKVDLVGTRSNRDGIGAWLKLTTPDGRVQHFETRSGSNLGGGDALDALFGLGRQTTVSELEITWPSGTVQRLTDIAADQRLVVREPDVPQSFTEVAASVGIREGCGPCALGNGLSFADFNGDGWDDLTFGTDKGQNLHFYQNMGGRFEKIDPPIINTDKNEQVLWVDYDNDGDKDLYVTNFRASNRLYNNDGNFKFTDVTAAAGLPDNYDDPSYGAVFGDYNNDGWLDLYVANWSYPPVHVNYLYRSNGDGTFTDVTEESRTADSDNLTFCSAFFDYNNDGWQDIYNSQDRPWSRNTLFRNTGRGYFEDVSIASGTNLAIDAMSVTVGDYDNDGDQDIYVTNTRKGNKLLRNNGDETFSEVAEALGVGFYRIGWGANFFDCDNDRDLDLYVSAQHLGPANASELYLNERAENRFREANPSTMASDTMSSFANAIGDFNNDGLPDIAVNNNTPTGSTLAPFHLWQNRTQNTHHWLKVKLQGVVSNREGIGSWIELYLNGEKYVRYRHCGIGYLAQNSDTESFGLGRSQRVDSLRVRWLSGHIDRLYDIAANQTLLIVEGLKPVATGEVSPPDRNGIVIGDLFPNPAAEGRITVLVEAPAGGLLRLRVVDVQGRSYVTEQRWLAPGQQRLSFDWPGLPAGLYFVHFAVKDRWLFRKLVVVP